MNNITIIPIKNLPEFSPKHDLADELIKGFENNNIALEDNDVIVVTSKFSHFEKRNRKFSEYIENGVKYYFLPELGYQFNRSPSRLLSHLFLSINIFIFLFWLKIFKKISFSSKLKSFS